MALWHNRDFLKLWAGQAMSSMGTQVTQLALPMTAILVLHASPSDLGVLGAAQFAPYLIFGLIAGVWVDRLRRRVLLIMSDVLRAVCIGLVPLLAGLDLLRIEYLYVIAFVFGSLSLLFDVAYQSYLPSLVERDKLVEGNAKLSASDTVAQVSGPAVSGWLVQAISAPFALVVDAVSYLLSALGLVAIRRREAPVPQDPAGRNVWREMGEGLNIVRHNRMLRVIAATTAVSNLFGRVLFTGYLLYLTNALHLSPAEAGLTFALSSVGSVLGVFVAGRMSRWLGLGRAIAASIIVGNAALLLVPAAQATGALALPVLLAGMFVWGLSTPVYNINQVSLRQAITPDRLLGRMNASMRFLVWGTVPIGYLLGGALGDSIGLWPTLLIGAVGGLAPVFWLLPSRLIRLRDQAEAVAEETTATDQDVASTGDQVRTKVDGGAK